MKKAVYRFIIAVVLLGAANILAQSLLVGEQSYLSSPFALVSLLIFVALLHSLNTARKVTVAREEEEGNWAKGLEEIDEQQPEENQQEDEELANFSVADLLQQISRNGQKLSHKIRERKSHIAELKSKGAKPGSSEPLEQCFSKADKIAEALEMRLALIQTLIGGDRTREQLQQAYGLLSEPVEIAVPRDEDLSRSSAQSAALPIGDWLLAIDALIFRIKQEQSFSSKELKEAAQS